MRKFEKQPPIDQTGKENLNAKARSRRAATLWGGRWLVCFWYELARDIPSKARCFGIVGEADRLHRTGPLGLASSCRRSLRRRSLIAGLPSGRRHDKTGAWEMYTDLSDRGIIASDD